METEGNGQDRAEEVSARKADAIDRKIGENARRLRRLRGVTQTWVADRLGVSYQQVQKYEVGANRLTAGRVYQLSQILEFPLAAFYDNVPHEGDSTGTWISEEDLIGLDEVLGPELIKALQSLIASIKDSRGL